MSSINRYNNYINEILGNRELYNYKDKKRNNTLYIKYFLNRTNQIFKYDGLPDTMPKRDIELMLQSNGNICVTEVKGNLYAFTGGLGGEPDPYYQPTIYTVANPALNFSENLIIGKDCILIRNDSLILGLIPLINRYTSQLTENDISINIASITTRLNKLMLATTSRTRENAELYLENLINGDIGILGNLNLFNESDFDILQSTQGETKVFTDLIELQQYLKASLYNELGLNANYNMKRESLNSAESQLNDDALIPFIDDMLENRQKGFDEVNKMYGTNIKVSLASAWEDNQIELDKEQENIKAEEPTEKGVDNDVSPNEEKTN